jgi:hypothetical protein
LDAEWATKGLESVKEPREVLIIEKNESVVNEGGSSRVGAQAVISGLLGL